MYNVTSTFKNNICAYGKEIDAQLVCGEQTYSGENIVSIKVHYDGALFKSIMRCCDIELDGISIPPGSVFDSVKFGVKANGSEFEYIDFGSFAVKEDEIEFDDANNALKLPCYDLMLYSMIPYDLVIDYSNGVTVAGLLQAICGRLGYTLATTEFTNSTLLLDKELYNDTYTYRDVLDEIAAVAAGMIGFKGDDKLYVIYPQETGEIIEPDNLKALTIGDKFGPVNSVVLARTPQEDNIYAQDAESIAENGLTEIKIENNQIIEHWRAAAESDSMDTRADTAKNAILSRMNGFTFYQYELTSYGIAYLEAGDFFSVKTLENNSYKVILLRDELSIGQALNEECKAEALKETETEYAAASKTDRVINQTILRIDKQENEITELITRSENTQADINGLSSKLTNALERIDTAEQSILTIKQTVDNGVTSVTTETGFTFDKEGLKISKSDEEMSSLIDNNGLYVRRDSEDILTANANGVNAINLTARKYLTIGKNSRLEDYPIKRTACFYVGEGEI